MDYRGELLNKILLELSKNHIGDSNKLKAILVPIIGDYDVTKKSTEIAMVDDENINLVKMFFATKKVEGGGDKTIKNRWCVIRKFDRDVNKPFSEVTTFDILNWLAKEQKRVTLSTTNSYRGVITAFFTWLFNNKFISENPTLTIKPIKHPEPIKKSFSLVEIDALKTACKTKLDRAMLELLLSSGLRCEELCNLKWEDVNFLTKDINVIEGKGNKNRVTMMDDVTKKYLMEYKESLNYDSKYVFGVRYGGTIKERTTDSVGRKLKAIAERANVNDVYPHRFRRSFATIKYKRGLDIRMIQKLLGHSNINTTMIYIDSDIETLRDAYKNSI